MSLVQVLEVLQPSSVKPVVAATHSMSNATVADLSAARGAIVELTELLGNSDMLALQRLAEFRELLAALMPEQLEALEATMQDLDFEAAKRACQEIADLLTPSISKH
jgi:hypothetical protein